MWTEYIQEFNNKFQRSNQKILPPPPSSSHAAKGNFSPPAWDFNVSTEELKRSSQRIKEEEGDGGSRAGKFVTSGRRENELKKTGPAIKMLNSDSFEAISTSTSGHVPRHVPYTGNIIAGGGARVGGTRGRGPEH